MVKEELGVEAHTCNPSAQEAKAGGLPGVPDQPEKQS